METDRGTQNRRHPWSLTLLTGSALAVISLTLFTLQDSTSAQRRKSERDVAIEKALLEATQKVQAAHLKQLRKVVTWASKNGLAREARKLLVTMRRLDARYPGRKKLKKKVKENLSRTEAKSDPEEARAAFAKKLQSAKEKNAKRLFGLATKCMKAGLFTRSYDLVNAVIDADPDHKRARSILSYAFDRKRKEWITKWEARMRTKNFLTDEGWIKRSDQKKWNKGLRPYLGKWLTIKEEARIRRRNEYNPFQVETEHFAVRTNLGRKQAFEFALLLEDFYQEFFRFFIGYYDQKKAAKLLFKQADLKKKHRVMVFPSRAKYLTFLKAEKGNDELLMRSAGFYTPADAQSYFYWGHGPETLDTLYHEVTHQLLAETKDRVSTSRQVWLIEGIATYMESWEKIEGKWHPGSRIDSPGMRRIRELMAEGFDFNLRSYIGLDHTQFHEPSRRSHNYEMGGALCHFFLHYNGEVYREDFIEFLKDYYTGKTSGDLILDYLHVEGVEGEKKPLETIEKQFKNHMIALGNGGTKKP